MSKEALKERIALTFEKNPKYDELFATSDNNVFTDEELAKQQAIRLKDTKVTPFKRPADKKEEATKNIEVNGEEEVKAPADKKKK